MDRSRVKRPLRLRLSMLDREKLGALPEGVEIRVHTIMGVEELDTLLDRVLVADSLAEMGLTD